MPSGHVLAFDFGLRNIGIAVGQLVTRTASPLATVNAKNGSPRWPEIDDQIKEWRPTQLLVGLPLNMDGTETKTTKPARQFGDALKARYNLPVHMVDERLSTRAAQQTEETLGQKPRRVHKRKLNKRAAQTILQSFLNDNPE